MHVGMAWQVGLYACKEKTWGCAGAWERRPAGVRAVEKANVKAAGFGLLWVEMGLAFLAETGLPMTWA